VTAVTAEAGRRLLTPRVAVPKPAEVTLSDYFSAEEIARGRRFARPQRAIGLARSALELAMVASLVSRPPLALARSSSRPVAAAAVAGAGLSAALTVPGLPLRALARRRAVTAGLDTHTWGGWLSDLGKEGVLQAGLSAAADAAVIAAARRWPRRWWLAVAGGTVVAGSLLGALAPVILDPIFNDFEPLPEGETRSDVLALAHDAGVSVGEVYSVDASRRTSAANAYVSGLGPTKRVVLYDTMLDRYSRDEIRLVVAHELGHMRHRDVPRNVAYAAILAPAVAWSVQQAVAVLRPGRTGEALGAADLPALMLAAGVVAATVGPSAAALSRAMERRADQFSLELAGAPEAFISFERGAALQNLADLTPSWLARRMASHPPTDERIGAALAFAGDTPAD
jgi:STE24 endopeptidase